MTRTFQPQNVAFFDDTPLVDRTVDNTPRPQIQEEEVGGLFLWVEDCDTPFDVKNKFVYVYIFGLCSDLLFTFNDV